MLIYLLPTQNVSGQLLAGDRSRQYAALSLMFSSLPRCWLLLLNSLQLL
jgi:hypothetical protein